MKHSSYNRFLLWLSRKDVSDLATVSMQQFIDKTNAIFGSSTIFGLQHAVLSSFLNTKIFQVKIRAILILIALILDISSSTFMDQHPLMVRYKTAILIFGMLGVSCFAIWVVWFYIELYSTRWNYFCQYMITTKNETFILNKPTKSFMKQCDEIYQSFELQENSSSFRKEKLQLRAHRQRESDQIEDITSYEFIRVALLIHFVIVFMIISTSLSDNCVNYVASFELVMLLFIFGLVLNELFVRNQNINNLFNDRGFLGAIVFVSYTSGMAISIFDHGYCIYQHDGIWISVLILQAIGAITCCHRIYKNYKACFNIICLSEDQRYPMFKCNVCCGCILTVIFVVIVILIELRPET
eukprot:44148_1